MHIVDKPPVFDGKLSVQDKLPLTFCYWRGYMFQQDNAKFIIKDVCVLAVWTGFLSQKSSNWFPMFPDIYGLNHFGIIHVAEKSCILQFSLQLTDSTVQKTQQQSKASPYMSKREKSVSPFNSVMNE